MQKYCRILALLSCVAWSAQAQVIKCTETNGTAVYQDHECATAAANAVTKVRSAEPTPATEPLEKYGLDTNCQARLDSDATQCNKNVADSLAQCRKKKLSAACASQIASSSSVKRDNACMKEIEAADMQCIPQSQSAIEQCVKASRGAKCSEQKEVMENNFNKQREDQTACGDKNSNADCPN